MAVPRSMGTGIAINFQPTGEGKAAITGDFVLIAEEVNPVLLALREHGIEVTALHNHMLSEEPRLFFMHFWANDDAAKLAKGLRAALGQDECREELADGVVHRMAARTDRRGCTRPEVKLPRNATPPERLDVPSLLVAFLGSGLPAAAGCRRSRSRWSRKSLLAR